jgi:hypothetical protein
MSTDVRKVQPSGTTLVTAKAASMDAAAAADMWSAALELHAHVPSRTLHQVAEARELTLVCF